jgi:hypothetical protein
MSRPIPVITALDAFIACHSSIRPLRAAYFENAKDNNGICYTFYVLSTYSIGVCTQDFPGSEMQRTQAFTILLHFLLHLRQ